MPDPANNSGQNNVVYNGGGGMGPMEIINIDETRVGPDMVSVNPGDVGTDPNAPQNISSGADGIVNI
jgi:hypothetical protein